MKIQPSTLISITILIGLSLPLSAAEKGLCDQYLERLQQVEKIEKFLIAHRKKVKNLVPEWIIPSVDAIDDHETSVLKGLQRLDRKGIVEWVSKNGNGANVFHGAPSPSLMAFIPQPSLGLLPNHVLISDLKIVPLTGVFDSLGSGEANNLNMLGMNVVSLGKMDQAFEYGCRDHECNSTAWRRSIRWIKDLELSDPPSERDRFRADLFQRRVEAIRSIPARLEWLILKPFPVVYGFQIADTKLVLRPSNAAPHTLVADNLSPSELRLVLVPNEKIPEVEDLLRPLVESKEIVVRGIEEAQTKAFGIDRNRIQEFLYEMKAHQVSASEFRRAFMNKD